MKKVSIWGVLIGGIVDVIATNILAFPLVVYMVLTQIDFIGMNQQEMTTAFTQAVQGDRMLFILQLMIGSFCSILGGYTAALIAKCNELLNGALSAYLCVAIGIYSIVS